MIWAERFAVGIFVLSFLYFALMMGQDFTFRGGLLFSGIIAGTAWIIFRTVDFLFGGPGRRKSRIS
jgi:hypothetical protein